MGEPGFALNGLKDATNELAVVGQWFTMAPEANFGIATGATSGIAVLDVDSYKDGTSEGLEAVKAACGGKLPETLTVQTGGGGWHVYFRLDEPLASVNGLRSGVDLKADGGYVVGVGSVHASGRKYECVRDVPIAALPEEIAGLRRGMGGGNNRFSGQPLPEEIFEGNGRYDALTSLAGRLRYARAGESTILAALRDFNATRCKPPYPDAKLCEIARSYVRKFPPGTSNGGERAEARMIARSFADIRPVRVEWLIPDRVPLGSLTLLAGEPGLGKSLITTAWAAQLSRGELACGPGGALIASAEDSPDATIRPRLEASRADMSFVHLVVMETEGIEFGIELPNHVRPLRAKVEETAAKLVVIDPLMAHLPPDVNSWKDQDLRTALAPLARMAEETRAAVVVVAHLNKTRTGNTLEKIGASKGLPAAARSALLLAPDPDDPEGDKGTSRILAHIKSNVSPLAPSERYAVKPVTLLDPRAGEISTARLEYAGLTDHAGSDLIVQRDGEERSATAEAAEFLREELADGPRPAKGIRAEAGKHGIPDRVLRRARETLGIKPEKTGGFHDGCWIWTLPKPTALEDAPPEGHLRKSIKEGHLRETPVVARDYGAPQGAENTEDAPDRHIYTLGAPSGVNGQNPAAAEAAGASSATGREAPPEGENHEGRKAVEPAKLEMERTVDGGLRFE